MKLYFRYVGMLFKSQMQYKASFLFMVLGQFLTSFTAFLGVFFLFDRFHSVSGFSFSEVLICFAVVLMAFSTAECFVRGFDAFGRLIRSGNLDRILVRPRSVVFQVLTSNMDFSRVGRFFQAVAMLGYAIPTCGVVWTPDKILTLVLMLLGGIAVFSGIFHGISLAEGGYLIKLAYSVAGVGNKLAKEDIAVAVEPFFYNRHHVFAGNFNFTCFRHITVLLKIFLQLYINKKACF